MKEHTLLRGQLSPWEYFGIALIVVSLLVIILFGLNNTSTANTNAALVLGTGDVAILPDQADAVDTIDNGLTADNERILEAKFSELCTAQQGTPSIISVNDINCVPADATPDAALN